jgi:phage minor structural protein
VSYPVLYDASEKEFGHGGFGFLSDCIQCEVTEEANGEFELFMRYPIDGIHFEDVNTRCIIKAKLDDYRDPQLFRIYSISKPMSKIVTIRAHHISYDLSGIPVSPFSASSAQEALRGLKQNAVVDCPFEFWTDKETTANFSVSVPSSIRSNLGGSAGSILDVFGGEYEFDNYTVRLYNSRGEDRGVFIRYGKNLLDINQEENVSAIATGLYPYWVDWETKEVLELPEKIVNAQGTYDFVRILPLDLSYEFIDRPTVAQMRSFTESYLTKNQIGVPSVSLSVSFAQIANSEEYAHLRLLERVSLFDTVSVEFPLMKVSTKAKVVQMVYDILLDKVKSMQVGSIRSNIADTVATLQMNQGG